MLPQPISAGTTWVCPPSDPVSTSESGFQTASPPPPLFFSSFSLHALRTRHFVSIEYSNLWRPFGPVWRKKHKGGGGAALTRPVGDAARGGPCRLLAVLPLRRLRSVRKFFLTINLWLVVRLSPTRQSAVQVYSPLICKPIGKSIFVKIFFIFRKLFSSPVF